MTSSDHATVRRTSANALISFQFAVGTLPADAATLTGLPIITALEEMMALLPPDAYKGLPGANSLTAIDSAYITERLTNIFGPCGLGWTFDFDGSDVHTHAEDRVSAKGRAYTVWVARLDRLQFQYVYLAADGKSRLSMPIPSNGGAENEKQGFAIRGAVTNALGAAIAKLCWQLPVYRNIIDHKNAAGAFNVQQGLKDSESESAVPTPPRTADARAKAGGKGRPTPTPKPKPNGRSVQPAAKAVNLNDAGSFEITFGKHKGQTLAQVPTEYLGWVKDNLQPQTPAAHALLNAVNAYLPL